MSAKLIHFDDPSPLPPIDRVGGKGYSLIRMCREGFPVPPGLVLTVDFFEPWLAQVTASDPWRAFTEAPPEEMVARAAALPALAESLAFDDEQARSLEPALERLDHFSLFAVRSSSPEEDLAGASFAGGYVTILGASRDTLESAVRRAFASCLEPRVFVYKRERGFEIDRALIAVVVQAQIASEIAGVGFSVEPISNDYDRGVFNANWGLGETVVSGLASPDQYVVDKVSERVVESVVGAKETSIWLLPDGGTEQRPDERREELTLDEERLAFMTRELKRVEDSYGRPMDIEWAWQKDEFYLLQARPITTFIPLPESIVTAPGERRRLYLDATLSIQGIQRPLSVMGQDFLGILLREFARKVAGHAELVGERDGLLCVAGNRMYVVLSHLFHLVEPTRIAAVLSVMDSLVGEVLLQVDAEEYRSDPCPPYLHRFLPRVMVHLGDVPPKSLEAVLLPEHSASVYHRKVESVLGSIETHDTESQNPKQYADWLAEHFVRLMVGTLIPPLLGAIVARSRLKEMFAEAAREDPSVADDLVSIDQALPHNVTVEMGMALYSIAESLAGLDVSSAEALGQRMGSSDLPEEAREGWQAFFDRFGFRGPQELDIAAPRYDDRPELVYKQIHSLLGLRGGDDPRSVHERSVRRREQAHARLERVADGMGVLRSQEFHLLYRAIEHFGGFRENHKYYLIKVISFLRRRVLREAESLVKSGRIKRLEQVFDLTLEDLTRVLDDPGVDLDVLISQNTSFLRKVDHVKEFPHVVDSRGRILRPKRPEPAPGELVGQAISPGRIRGPVKVLHSADEEPLLPGEILVARATDPGWTPLFVNAAAIVLEVGGVLQHGSLVAREYGKPCVAGIQDATSRLQDGEVVEVDGSAGVVRLNPVAS